MADGDRPKQYFPVSLKKDIKTVKRDLGSHLPLF